MHKFAQLLNIHNIYINWQMRISSIKIKNFKPISSLVLHPKQINILIGRNNTGKTSVLQAISLAFDESVLTYEISKAPGYIVNFDSDSSEIDLSFESNKPKPKSVILGHPSVPDLIEIIQDHVERFVTAYNRNVREYSKSRKLKGSMKELEPKFKQIERDKVDSIVIESVSRNTENQKLSEASNESLLIRRTKHSKKFFSESTWKFIQETEERLAQISSQEGRHMLLREFGDFELYGPWSLRSDYSSHKYISSISPVFVTDPIESLYEFEEDSTRIINIEKEIEEMLKKGNLVPGIQRFRMNSLIIKGEKGDHAIPMNEMGDGFKALVGLIYKLKSAPHKKIVMLEEPEVHMHPGYLEQLVKYIIDLSKGNEIQFFISTHSSDFVQYFLDSEALGENRSAFLKANLEIFRLTRSNNEIHLENLDYETGLHEFKDLYLDLRGI